MKRFKFWLLNKVVQNLFKGVLVSDVISMSKDGRLFLNGIQMADSEIRAIQEEAKFVQATRLWSIMTSTLAWQAQKRMFEKSKIYDDMFFGKASLYNLDVQDNIMNTFKNYLFKK